MRRVIVLMAAALLALTMAGPVSANPVPKSQFPHVYVTVCADGPEVPDQMAHAIPGWDLTWQPRDTPWLLMGYTFNFPGGTAVAPLPPGLVGNGKLFGPCTITWGDSELSLTDAWYMRR